MIDNAGAFVSHARPTHFEWNPHFLELCGYYRIEPWACGVRGARTKGKVERPFYFVENHLIKGNSWTDFDALGRDLLRFTTEVLDVREHLTTHQPPIERFAEEVPYLTPLPQTLVGAPGTGKSHLAIAIGIRACGAHKRVLFRSVAELLDELVAATVDHTLGALQTLRAARRC